MTTTAAAPSEIWEAVPAVIVPFAPNAGFRAARAAASVCGRTPSSAATVTDSPLRPGISIGTISTSKRPCAWAAAARRWERAANSSWSCRDSGGCASYHDSVSWPMP